MGDVVVVPPRVVKQQYRKHLITISFLPQTREWSWTFEHHATVIIQGTAKDIKSAINDARERLDTLLGGVDNASA